MCYKQEQQHKSKVSVRSPRVNFIVGGFGRKRSFKPQGALRLSLTVAEKNPNVIQKSSLSVKRSAGEVRGEVTGKDLFGAVWEAA